MLSAKEIKTMQTVETHTKTKIVAAIIAIAVIVGVVVIIEALQKKPDATVTTAASAGTSSSQAATGSSASQSTTSSAYKDGTYTAQSSYDVPHGSEDISVTLTVASGVVTNSTITNSESDDDSARYQEAFADQYKSYVVGKKLSDIDLSYVAGASDTTEGFNDALTSIKSQAKA